jgi:hypothetical protein
MFTGIIEGLGTLEAIKAGGQGRQLALAAGFDLEGTKIGDSIAVNGACLTVVRLQGRRFEVDVSPETMARTTFKNAKVGSPTGWTVIWFRGMWTASGAWKSARPWQTPFCWISACPWN